MKALAEQRRVGLLAGKLAGGSGVARTARLAVEHSEPASVATQGLGLAKLGKLAKFFQIFGGLILGRIKTKFCKIIISKYAFDSIFQALQDLHPFAPLQSQHFSKKSVRRIRNLTFVKLSKHFLQMLQNLQKFY